MNRKVKMRKCMVFLLAIAMVLTMSVPAFAAEEDSTANTETAPAAAQIGNQEYTSLKAAIDAIQDETATTIVLAKDVNEDILVEKGKNITLDLNGKILTGTGASGVPVVSNKGTFSLVDSAGNGKVQSAANANNYVLDNQGEMILGTENGENSFSVGALSETNTASIIRNGWEQAGDKPADIEKAVMIVNGGQYTGNTSSSQVIVNKIYGDAVINDGVFTQKNKATDRHVIFSFGKLMINNGTFKKEAVKFMQFCIYTMPSYVSDFPSEARINNGVFNVSGSASSRTVKSKTGSSLLVYGGTHNAEILTINLPEGYACIQNKSKKYEVGAYIAEWNKTGYGTILEAIEAAKNSTGKQTIKLLQNTAESIDIPENMSVHLDLNGHVLTGTAGDHTIDNKGVLQISGTGKSGIVTNTEDKQAIYNSGKITFTSTSVAKISRSEGSNGNVVYNSAVGNMTVGAKVSISSPSSTSSCVYNLGELKLGTSKKIPKIDGAAVTVKNDGMGVLTVSNADITGYDQAIQNCSQATISGGIINGAVVTLAYSDSDGVHVGQTEITGGTIEGKDSGSVIACWYTGEHEAEKTPEVTITGGAINGAMYKASTTDGLNMNHAEYSDEKGVIAVSDGTFDQAVPKELCANGYDSATEPDENGKYSVIKLTAENSVASVISVDNSVKYYTTFEEALEAAKDGDTVELLKNVEIKNGETVTIASGVTLKINDNEKLTNEGTVEVYGEISGEVSGNGITNYHIKNIAINAHNDSMKIGEEQNLTVTKIPENAVENVTWSVDNDKVANIDENGKLIAIGEGTVTVTAKAADGVNADCTITISKKSAPEAPTGIQGINETVKGRNDGKITGVTDKMEYRKKTESNSENWIACGNDTVSNLAPETYEVRVAETSDTEAGLIADVTIETGEELTYTLNVTVPAFDTVEYGYKQPAAKPITISSTGNSDAAIDGVTVNDVDGKEIFVISGNGSNVTAGDQIDTWTIQPAENLDAGNYKATITVTYDNNTTATAEVTFTVVPAVQEDPVKAEIKDSTYTTITLAKIDANKNGATAKYSSDGGKAWQDSNVFENLLPGTEYTFVVRYDATKDGNYAESPVSEAIKASTGIGATAATVTPDDRKALSDEKSELERALENGAYSDADKAKLKQRISEIDAAFNALENAGKVSDMIGALPDAEDVQKNDADAINAAKAAYDKLTAHEKELAGDEAKAKLDSALAALSKLDNEPESGEDFSDDTDPVKNSCNAKMEESKEDLISFLLTAEEKNQLEKGEEVKVWLEVTDISATVSETDKDLINSEKENSTVAMYLDIELLKQIGSNHYQHITETKGPVTITLKVPDSFVNSDESVTRTYQVIRVHDGKVTVIPCTYSEANQTISFETDQFSTYALAYVDQQNGPDSGNTTEPTKPGNTAKPTETNPNAGAVTDTQTGDDSNLFLWFALLCISGFGVTATVVASKKKKASR